MNVNDIAIQTSSNASGGASRSEWLSPYLTIKQVSAMTTLARSSIYNRVSDAKDPLPRPSRVGHRVM